MVDRNEYRRLQLKGRGRWLVLALLLGAACLMSLAGKARAADCMTPEDCSNAAAWQQAMAQNSYNQGLYFQAYAKQYFADALEWNNKATFAFHAGDATAAAWYKAIANNYAKNAAANATAANDHFNAAKFENAAAGGNLRRAFALAAFFNPGSSAAKQASDAQAAGVDADTTAVAAGATAPERCRNPKDNTWHKLGLYIEVKPYNLCYRKPKEITQLNMHYDEDNFGPAAILAKGDCSDERFWYDWHNHGSHAGRKVIVTCTWYARTPGIGPIPPVNIARKDCSVNLYFHADGSHWYDPKGKCTQHFF